MLKIKDPRSIPLYGLTAAFLWGIPYPLIKLGVAEFMVEATFAKTLFAGVRFFIAGLIILMIAKGQKKSLAIKRSNIPWILALGGINTALHYFCFYVGLSNSQGSRASILNSMGSFLLVFLSCSVFPEEHMSRKKVIGCIVGFTGLVVLNMGAASGTFTLAGDGMIIMNALCSAFGGILTRIVCQKEDAVVATGYSVFCGGFMLITAGTLFGGRIGQVTPKGILILAILVAVSSVAFTLYNQLISIHSVGKVAIYNSTIPIFGSVMSCLLLGEMFYPRYALAALLVAGGVYIINRQ